MNENLARKLIDDMGNLEAFLALPETTRAELINDTIIRMEAPGHTHQKIVWGVHVALSNYIQEHGGNCEVGTAPFDIFLDDENIYEPDVFIVCDPGKIQEDGCHGAPDFVMEVLSKSTRKRDTIDKRIHYIASGVREYWIVDPDRRNVIVFRTDEIVSYTFDDDIPVEIYEGLRIRLSSILPG